MKLLGTPQYFQDRGVAHKLYKRKLLIAVNLVAGLSIFFFGRVVWLSELLWETFANERQVMTKVRYTRDSKPCRHSKSIQGVMGGVNGNRNYAKTMGFGYYDPAQDSVQVTNPLLQGSIVRQPS